MVSNAGYPAYDPTGTPASLSAADRRRASCASASASGAS